MKNDVLYLIDGSSYIYRAFFAIRRLTNSKGLPTNAVLGVANMINKVICDRNPKYLAVIYDSKEKNFRHKLFPEYKATRKKMDDELIAQIPYIKRLIEAYRIPSVEVNGYEADDIIATCVEKFSSAGQKIVIVSGDKDLMQLISDDVTMLDTLKDKEYQVIDVIERFKVPPEKVREVMGLSGDSSDNIPGVPGIGEKTASALIERFGSMEALYERISEVKGKVQEKLKDNREKAFLSKKLVTLYHKVPLELKLDDFTIKEPDLESLVPLLKELEFSKLLTAITAKAPPCALPGALSGFSGDESAGSAVKTLSYDDYHIVKDKALLEEILAAIIAKGEFAVDLETTSCDPMLAEIVGISLCSMPGKSYYVPVGHTGRGSDGQLDKEYVLRALKELLEDERLTKIGQNIKYEYVIFKRHGIEIKGAIEDTMVASYLLNPAKHNHKLSDISIDYLNHRMILYKEVVGAGNKEVTFNEVSVDDACVYSAEDSDVTYRLAGILLPKLKDENLFELYADIERPLIRTLADMEMTGVLVDREKLGALSKKFSGMMAELETEIYSKAGEEFNINSPKQLGWVLFNKLNMPAIKKTKTGYSTDVAVLTELAEVYEYELPKNILRYRSISKLKSGFTDALEKLINPNTNRLHTSYNQTITSTGRLSSSEPNLQNIPVRSEEGRLIRSAFIAGEGKRLISADYSQVELRILADMSCDETMLRSFENGEDVHTRTASEVFDIFPEMVTPDMRRAAKVINFGIVYGMSAFGLSRELKIPPKLAKQYIDGYFRKYVKVKEYIDDSIRRAHERGFVTTLFNRRLSLPDIYSRNKNIVQMAERNAINAPIQGTAADIIKIAMIRLHDIINQKGLKSRMILQVHDELVFEVADDEIDIMTALVRKEMESAGKPYIKIPLLVEVNSGRNWSEAH